VVASERRLRTDNDNGGLVDEQLRATAFIAHPYQLSTGSLATSAEGLRQIAIR
jgi:zinc protease